MRFRVCGSCLDAHAPGGETISMTIGEPRHPMPDFVAPILAASIQDFAVYPPNDGTPELLTAISGLDQPPLRRADRARSTDGAERHPRGPL